MSLHTSLRRTAATVSSTTSTILPSQLPTSQSKATTFLITLTDGSAFTHRTTSPAPVYRSTRDTRNSLLWNPSSSKLMNVEDDEAGRLAAFRARFGRSWDASAPPADAPADAEPKDPAAAKAKEEAAKAQAQAEQEEEDNLLDLISSFGQEENQGSGKKKN
ncbi:unnamed protein product [Penicillium manginii]